MVVKFDCSSIPTNANIISAKVSVFMCGPMYEGTNGPKSVYRVTKNWSEATVTFNDPWTVKGGDYAKPALAKSSNTAHNTWEDYDVTEAIKDMVKNKSANFGFLFKFDTLIPRRGSCIYSSEHAKANLRPKLTITSGDSVTQSLPDHFVMLDGNNPRAVTVFNLLGRRIASSAIRTPDQLYRMKSGLPAGVHITFIRLPMARSARETWIRQ